MFDSIVLNFQVLDSSVIVMNVDFSGIPLLQRMEEGTRE